MKWETITLEQYQAIYKITHSKMPEWEMEMELVSTIFNLTEKELEALPIDHYRELKKQIAFLYQPLPQVKPKAFSGKKYHYKLVTDVRKMPFGRYAEVKSFVGEAEADFISNLHMLTASIVKPYHKVGPLLIPVDYDPARHREYAEDLLQAPFIQVHASAVFFYLLFTYSIKSLKDYMMQQMKQQKVTSPELTYTHLCATLDGFIQQNNWPTMKASLLMQLGIFPPFKP
jgi:hypothetical protein